MRFKEGDKVVVAWNGMVGVAYSVDNWGRWQVRGNKARLQGPDDYGARWATAEGMELLPHSWVRPGIGAVVAMVAAAKMQQGGWSFAKQPEPWPIHWRFGGGDWPVAWCGGDPFPSEDDIDGVCTATTELADVTCPKCLKMARRVYGEVADVRND